MDAVRTDEQIRRLYGENAAHLNPRLFKSELAQRLPASRAREHSRAVRIIPVVGTAVIVVAALGFGIDALIDHGGKNEAVVITGGTMSPGGSSAGAVSSSTTSTTIHPDEISDEFTLVPADKLTPAAKGYMTELEERLIAKGVPVLNVSTRVAEGDLGAVAISNRTPQRWMNCRWRQSAFLQRL